MTTLEILPGTTLNLDSIARLAVAAAAVTIGFLAVVREQGNRVAVGFFGLVLAVALWLGGAALAFAAPDPASALWWNGAVAMLGVSFIPSLVLLFVIRVTGSRRRLRALPWAAAGLSAVFYAAFRATNWLIPSAVRMPWGYSPKYSTLALSFFVFLVGSLGACAVLLRRRRSAVVTETDRHRSRAMMVALAVSSLGLVDFLPVFGVEVYPFGYVGIAGFVAVAGWVLHRYGLTAIAPDSAGREIIRTTADGIVALSVDGFIRFANDSATRLFGTAIGRHVGESSADLPCLSPMAQRLAAVLEHGSSNFEAVIPGREQKTASFSASVIYDDEHTPALVVFIARDLSQHVKDEAALRYERNLLRTLIDALPVGVYVKDTSRRKLIANPIDLEWMRYWAPQGEVLGKTDEEIFPPELAAGFAADDRKVLESGAPVVDREEYLRRPDGSGRWTLTTKLPLFDADGQVAGLLGTGRDITEQKRQAEERERLLAEAVQERDRAEAHAAQLDAVFASMAEGVILYGPDSRVVRANKVAERLLALRTEEGHARPASAPSGLVSETGEARSRHDLPMRRALRGETVLDEVLGFEPPSGGETVWLSINAGPVRDHRGQVTGAILTFHDVSERKKAQQALAESEEQLRQAQKMEAIGRLAGGVAHDFNNLLTVINGYSELVLTGMEDGSPHRSAIGQIQKSGERAASLTRKLLAFGRKQVLQPKVVDLNRVLADLEKLLKRLIGEDIELAFSPDPLPVNTRVDPGQFEQVIINLAVNARDAMPEGGRLSISTRRRQLDEEFTRHHRDVRPGRYAEVVVSDSGAGMDEATQARVFEPFFTTKDPSKGTGLGLAMVYGFVKQSEGHIEVSSEVGRGTTFRVCLPLVGEAPTAADKPPNLAESPRGTETILLIEDEESVRGLVRLMLRSKGYRVLEACDGEQAVTTAHDCPDPIHLLVTDLVMPRMGGRQVADVLSRSRPAMRVLFMSGYTDEEVMRRGVAGAAYIQKPFSPAILARKVREILDS